MDSSEGGHAFLISRQDDADLRASDGERDQVADELGTHFQSGRLDQAEFDERLTLALQARTRKDLARLLTDLPAQPPVPAAAAEPARAGGGVRCLPLLVPLLFVALISASIGGHGGAGSGAGLLPLLWLWWVIPILVVRARRQGR